MAASQQMLNNQHDIERNSRSPPKISVTVKMQKQELLLTILVIPAWVLTFTQSTNAYDYGLTKICYNIINAQNWGSLSRQMHMN